MRTCQKSCYTALYLPECESMRIVCLLMFLLMLLFMGVQYNDPDGPLWIGIYCMPALWLLLAAVRPEWLAIQSVKLLFLLCLVGAVAGMVYFWPTTPQWWTKDVWWETETAREGMGMMIVLLVLLIAAATGWRHAKIKKSE